MASLQILQHLFAMSLVILQSSPLLLAQQGVIDLQSTPPIQSPTAIKATPAPLLISATPIAKMARKYTPTPILLGLASRIQTPSPLRMDRIIVPSIILKTIAQLSPVPVLAQNILPAAASVISHEILPKAISIFSQEIIHTASSSLPPEILPTADSVMTQEILITATTVLPQEILPTAVPLTTIMKTNSAPSQAIINPINTSMQGFVTFSFNDMITHLKEVSSAIIKPTPQSLSNKITNILFPQSDHIVSTISPTLGNSQFDFNTLFPLKGNFDTLEMIKKLLNIEPTKIKPVETILDTMSLTKSQISMSLISSTQPNHLTASLPTQSIFSINQSLTPKVSSPEPTRLMEKPILSEGIIPETVNSNTLDLGGLDINPVSSQALSNNQNFAKNLFQNISPQVLPNNQNIAHQLFQNISPHALSNNQNIARQLFQNISSFPAPVYVTIILSPTIILASTNTSSAMQQTNSSPKSSHVLSAHIQSSKTLLTELNQNIDTNHFQHSGATFGLMPSKHFIPTDLMTQKVLPTPNLPNTQGQVFQTALVPMALVMTKPVASVMSPVNNSPITSVMKISSIDNKNEIPRREYIQSSTSSNAKSLGGNFISNFKPFIVNTGNFTARIRPFRQGSDNPNNLSLMEAVNLIRNANPTNFNSANSNGHSYFLNKINQNNNFKNPTLSQDFFSALPNKRLIHLNQFSNNSSRIPAIIVSNPQIRNPVSPKTFNPAFSQVSNIQANRQLLQSVNQQQRFPHLNQKSNPAEFNLPFILPAGNNGIPGNSSFIKKIRANSNFPINNLGLGNLSSLPNKKIHPLAVDPNNSSRVNIIILSKPNTNLKPFLIRNGNFTTIITPNHSFNQVPNLQTNPHFRQALNRQAGIRQLLSSPLIQNANFSNFTLPFVFPPRNNNFPNQLPNLNLKREHDNLVNRNISLGNTPLVTNQTLHSLNVFRLKSGFTPRISNSPSLNQNNSEIPANLFSNGMHTLAPRSPLLPAQSPPSNDSLPNTSATNKVFTRLKSLQQTIKKLKPISQLNNASNP